MRFTPNTVCVKLITNISISNMLKISDNNLLFRWLSIEELRTAAAYHYFRSRDKDLVLDDDS